MTGEQVRKPQVALHEQPSSEHLDELRDAQTNLLDQTLWGPRLVR